MFELEHSLDAKDNAYSYQYHLSYHSNSSGCNYDRRAVSVSPVRVAAGWYMSIRADYTALEAAIQTAQAQNHQE